MPHFLNLPPELHTLITEFLPVESLLQLRLTSAYFHHLIPRLSHDQLLQAESTDWARHRDLYACRYCLRLRPVGCFANRMLRRRRSRAGRDSGKRFCVECGLRPRQGTGTARYGPGAQITIQGAYFVLCLSCRQFQPGARDRLGRNTLECVSCWQAREARTAEEQPVPPSVNKDSEYG